MLALNNLYNVLKIFYLYKDCIGDIIVLLKYVYVNTSDLVDGIEDMRAFLIYYMGFEMDILMEDDCFQRLIIDDEYDGEV